MAKDTRTGGSIFGYTNPRTQPLTHSLWLATGPVGRRTIYGTLITALCISCVMSGVWKAGGVVTNCAAVAAAGRPGHCPRDGVGSVVYTRESRLAACCLCCTAVPGYSYSRSSQVFVRARQPRPAAAASSCLLSVDRCSMTVGHCLGAGRTWLDCERVRLLDIHAAPPQLIVDAQSNSSEN